MDIKISYIAYNSGVYDNIYGKIKTMIYHTVGACPLNPATLTYTSYHLKIKMISTNVRCLVGERSMS